MKKKILINVLIFLICFILIGCESKNKIESPKENVPSNTENTTPIVKKITDGAKMSAPHYNIDLDKIRNDRFGPASGSHTNFTKN